MGSRAVPIERCQQNCTKLGIGNITITSKVDTKAVPGKAGKAGRVRRESKSRQLCIW
jgi:hypothetical protein